MTGPLIKQEIPPSWELKDEDQPVALAGYIQYTFPGEAYGPFEDIAKCSPYGPFIDYTLFNTYPQCINPAFTVRPPSPLSPVGSPSPPPPIKETVPCKNKKRTSTSYDKETSHYLKSVFFNVYSKQNKLTKKQRREVREKTGLTPRKITYWFSNHKRRFKKALEIYKAAVKNSHDKITCYDEFVLWRRSQNLPDDVTRSEMEHLD